MTKILVTPVAGRRVRHPDGRLLGAEGATVERSPYWLRRERDGDVTVKKPAAPKVQASTTAKAARSDKKET
ncbi:MAG: DUF2635 domain-containing protein [Tistlia sp.]|uniref:DUF2635 domain-containing protein n=1 Tax=Tistlia sp. TaxID=3057121 RepID=UPI0034A3FF67